MARRRKRPKIEREDPEQGDISVDVLDEKGEVADTKFFKNGMGVNAFIDTQKGKKCMVYRYDGWVFDREVDA